MRRAGKENEFNLQLTDFTPKVAMLLNRSQT